MLRVEDGTKPKPEPKEVIESLGKVERGSLIRFASESFKDAIENRAFYFVAPVEIQNRMEGVGKNQIGLISQDLMKVYARDLETKVIRHEASLHIYPNI